MVNDCIELKEKDGNIMFMSIAFTDHVILHLIRSKSAEQRTDGSRPSVQGGDDDGMLYAVEIRSEFN